MASIIISSSIFIYNVFAALIAASWPFASLDNQKKKNRLLYGSSGEDQRLENLFFLLFDNFLSLVTHDRSLRAYLFSLD